MQHVRKIVLIFSIVIFIVAAALCAGMIFAVRNINVTLLSYTYQTDEEGAKAEISELKEKVLEKYRGKLISSVGEEGITETLGDGEYVLESFRKVYPCTVEITVKERRELYAEAYLGVGYRIYDEEGKYLKTAEENINAVDGAPDVLIEGFSDSDDIKAIAGVGKIFSAKFGALRSVTEKIILEKAQSSIERDKAVFVLRCGVSIEIRDFRNMTAGKIDAAYRCYEKLSGERKLQGRIYCTVTSEGVAAATYSANG